MISNQKSLLGIIFVVLLFVVVSLFFKIDSGNEQVACTLEALICPDGTAVGRTGPNCEFALCPSTSTSTPVGEGGILSYKSGIRGIVMVGPTCPVERDPPDPNCADKPLSTPVKIFRASNLVDAIVTTESDKEGNFQASLPPGDYVVGAGENVFPRCNPTSVIVKSDIYVDIVVECDSGIR